MRDDRLVARLLGLGLAVDVAADLDVEQVDLPVDGDELAVGVEDAARVRELLAAVAPLGDRAADERDRRSVRAQSDMACDRLAAVEWLSGRAEIVGVADHVPLLRQHDDVGAGRRRARDERLGALEVRGLVRREVIWTHATRIWSGMA